MHLAKKHWVFSAIAGLLAVVMIEAGLRLFSAAIAEEPAISDPRLGHRPNPAYPGHDRRGFRNPAVLSSADVVALGDSQTYGTGVAPEAAWPQQLASMSAQQKVYSMAFGGYGPAHSLMLWDEAAALRPKVIVEAFYAGNDLYDAYKLVHVRGQLPELRSTNAELLERIRKAEAVEPIDAIIDRLYKMGPTPDAGNERAAQAPVPATDGVRAFLVQHSMILSVLATAKHEAVRSMSSPQSKLDADWRAAKAFAAARPQFCELFEDARSRTVFTSAYRLAALDLGDPRMEEGLNISLRAMRKMSELAAAANVRLVVLMIPTKEAVFRDRAQALTPAYRRLVEAEARLWTVVHGFLAQNGIAAVDALPALQAQLAAGIQPYPVSHDGHPNEQGHKIIAAQIAQALACAQSSANCSR